MAIENIKIQIYQRLEELFSTAVVDEMTGDTDAFTIKLNTIAKVAEALDIETEITTVHLTLKQGEAD